MYEDVKTAALYVRYSSANQTEQSIEGQVRVCTEFCERHGIRIVETYADRATSASKDIEKRVEFLRMIKDSEKHPFDAVVVYKLDRFSRSRYDMATYKYKLRKNGVQLISATENISQDPEGIILESVLEGMAEFYSAELAQKINRGLRESAYKHISLGGHAPLGYKLVDKKLQVDENTAYIVQEAYQRFADGDTVAQICRDFNAAGYRTSRGQKFGKSSFVKMFRNEKYIGVYEYKDYRNESAIPPIISKELWEKVQMRLQDQKPSGEYKAKSLYLLSGKIFCGQCGKKYNANSNQQGYQYYECWGKKNLSTGCSSRNIRKDWIEKVILDDALSLLTDENVEIIASHAAALNDRELSETTEIPAIKARKKEIETSLNNLTKAIESGSAPEILVKRISELEHEKRVLEARLAEEEKTIIDIDKPRIIHWLTSFRDGDLTDPEYQKTIIDLFIRSVTIFDEPDNSFRLKITYNLSPDPKTIGFDPQRGGWKSKSDVLERVIVRKLLPHKWAKFGYESRKDRHDHAGKTIALGSS